MERERTAALSPSNASTAVAARPLLPQPQRPFDISDLSRNVALILGLQDPCALQTGASIAGERVFLLYDEDLDTGVHILIDVGSVGSGEDAHAVLRALMEVNPELSPARGESFGLDRRKGRILFRAFLTEADSTPPTVVREIAGYVSLLLELRAGPLSALARMEDPLHG
jgi:hypothetical protein